MAWCAPLLCAEATVDLDGDGASEFWNLKFPHLKADESDFDSDGQSNRSEMIAGTDPTDGSRWFRLHQIVFEAGEVVLSWNGIPGKQYVVESWSESDSDWLKLDEVMPVSSAQTLQIRYPELEIGAIYRIKVSDFDADQDGVNGWEEFLLGWSDTSEISSGHPEVGDYEQAIRELESASGASLVTGETLPRRLPNAAEAARFLVQTSFGPTQESIAEVMDVGIVAYYDDQLSLSPSLSQNSMFRTGMSYSTALWRHGWWRSALIAPDQLRQRMAYALSQIFVMNTEGGSVIGDNINTQAAYYDPFIQDGFGDFRTLLNHVAYSPAMGFYLSHLNNRKSDPSVNRFPDENFAREIMQLFTIGLWKLNPDGTRQLDNEGNDIPTYDNSVITEMAKVFTGMSNSTTNRGQTATSFFDSATGDDYRKPMVVWDDEHEPGAKILFDGVTIASGQTGDEDVQQTLDALSNHDNTAPFIGRLLIQRFTSSNPSPDYMLRVSRAWDAGDGDLERVMRSVLFDPEARNLDLGAGLRGKVREPLIRMTHLMRAFALPDPSGRYGVLAPDIKKDLGQFVMSSPSVFNFYLPDYSPRGELFDLGLVAPEFQIATTSALLATRDLLKTSSTSGHWVRGVDLSEELALVVDGEALADHLDVLLAYGTMSEATRAAVLERVAEEPNDSARVKIAIHMVVTSPEFSILK